MAGVDVKQDQLARFEDAPRLFGPDEVDLLDKIAAQATDADYAATEHLLREARKREQR